MYTHTHNNTICLVFFLLASSRLLFDPAIERQYHGFLYFFVFIVFVLDYFALSLSLSVCIVCTTISFIADLLGDLLEGFSFVCTHIFRFSYPTHISDE